MLHNIMPGYFHRIRLFIKIRNFFSCFTLYILSLLLLFNYNAAAQRTKIDSLKSSLYSLHGSARIDCLNVLSLGYTYLLADSARLYADNAYEESVAINYQRGIIMSMNNKARIEGLVFRNFPLQEKLCLQTIGLYKNLENESVLTETYMNLALSLFCQSYFKRSAEACAKLIQLSQKAGDKKELGEATAVLGSISFESGHYEKSFEYFNHGLEIFKSINDS